MRLVKFVLSPEPPVKGAEPLYLRLSGGAAVKENGILMPEGSVLLTDTYFNLLSAKYFRYAEMTFPYLELEYRGDIAVELRFRGREREELLAGANFSSEQADVAHIDIPVRDYGEGFVYVAVTSLKDDSVVTGGGYFTSAKPRRVKLGVVICTFKREEYVKNNVKRLAGHAALHPEFKRDVGIFVVDNGRTLDATSFPEGARLIPNANTGGAGGFTRGLREVVAEGDYTHFLFMDDDIALEPFVIERTVKLLAVMKESYYDACIGGSMLMLDKPVVQHELGARWLGNAIKGNLKDLDLSSPKGLLENERDLPTDYCAWWYMCMPVSAAEKAGFPLELLFVKLDDVEFGLRAARQFILINGIGVWHENFDYKSTSFYEYFNKRNFLILSSRYPRGKGMLSDWWMLVRAVGKALVEQNYFVIDLVLRAYDDFLAGADYVAGLDPNDLIRELASVCPKQNPAEEIEAALGLDLDSELKKSASVKKKFFREFFTLNSYLIPSCFYRKVAVAHMVKPRPIDFYKTKRAVHYNPYTRTAYVTEIRKRELFSAGAALLKMFFKMLLGYKKAAASFRTYPPAPTASERLCKK